MSNVCLTNTTNLYKKKEETEFFPEKVEGFLSSGKSAYTKVYYSLFRGSSVLSSVGGNTRPAIHESNIFYYRIIYLEAHNRSSGNQHTIVVDLMKRKNLNILERMKEFDENWNGNGGKTFSYEAITYFESIINALIKQPVIAPTGRESLYMQYKKDDKSILAFEVSADKTEKVYVPQGKYSLAESETFDTNVQKEIKESVEIFYES